MSKLSNLAGQTLTGGSWVAHSNSTLSLAGAVVTTNAATIVLDGVGSSFTAADGLSVNQGTFAITGGRTWTSSGPLTNTGETYIDSSSVAVVKTSLENTGSIDLNKALIVITRRANCHRYQFLPPNWNSPR